MPSSLVRDSRIPLTLASATLGMALVSGVLTLWRKKVVRGAKAKDEKDAVHEPPLAPPGILDTIAAISGKDMPLFALEWAKQCKSSIYKLRLPIPGGCYVVSDYLAQREIYQNGDKPLLVYSPFNKITGKGSIYSLSSADPLHKHLRKGAAPAFSNKEVSRMDAVCKKHAEAWIQDTLLPCIQENKSFDPSYEMTKLIFFITMESALEVETTTEEYNELLHHLELALREYGLKQGTNPLRALFAPFIQEARQAKQSAQWVHQGP